MAKHLLHTKLRADSRFCELLITYFFDMRFANEEDFHNYLTRWWEDLLRWSQWAYHEQDPHLRRFYIRTFTRQMTHFIAELREVDIQESDQDGYLLNDDIFGRLHEFMELVSEDDNDTDNGNDEESLTDENDDGIDSDATVPAYDSDDGEEKKDD
jgi:hypothetical protein